MILLQPGSLDPFGLPLGDLDHVASRTELLWRELGDETVFLTGASGFIGRWLAGSCLWAWHRYGCGGTLHALVRDADAFFRHYPQLQSHPQFRLHRGDLKAFPSLPTRLGVFIHAAVDYGPPDHVLRTNLEGMFNALDFATRTGVQRMIFTSSGAVYGPQPLDVPRLSESFTGAPPTQNPTEAYGTMKRACEAAGFAWAKGSHRIFTSARCFSFLGPGCSPTGVAGQILSQGVAGGPIHLTSDGSPLRSFMHPADLAIWLWTLLLKPETSAAWNVGSEDVMRIGSLAATARDLLCPGAPVVTAPPLPQTPGMHYIPNTERARSAFNLEQSISIRDAILSTAQWMKGTRIDQSL